MMKQHHVHVRNPDTRLREPPGACKRKDKPKLCKSDFPRMSWLVREAVFLCANLLDQMGLPTRGRRCQLGSLHGPMNHEFINGTHPSMLATQRCNSDVQLFDRIPMIKEYYLCCHCKCILSNDKVMVEAMQLAQDAQAGYACDYCTKRQPMAFNEVKECCK